MLVTNITCNKGVSILDVVTFYLPRILLRHWSDIRLNKMDIGILMRGIGTSIILI